MTSLLGGEKIQGWTTLDLGGWLRPRAQKKIGSPLTFCIRELFFKINFSVVEEKKEITNYTEN